MYRFRNLIIWGQLQDKGTPVDNITLNDVGLQGNVIFYSIFEGLQDLV